jgi:hypothetical protein
MNNDDFKPMGADPRWLSRHQRRGVRGELIKRLSELIKNADDAYDRLELKGEKTSGIIEIAYDMIKTGGGGYSPKGFIVRDFGSGMTREKAIQAYYGDNYGSDTSDETRNGAIGVGGKDCFIDMENCYILTICEKVLTVIQIVTLPNKTLASKIMDDDEAQIPFNFINEKFRNANLEEISLSKNQTIAAFQIPSDVPGARPDKLAEQLRQFYTLRWILESNTRKVKLTDLTNCNTFLLKHKPLDGELLKEKTYEIVFNQKPYEVKIQFFKHDTDLPYGHHSSQGYGILIQSNRGVILDNQMYGFENDPGASKIFGKIIFNDWKQLYRDSNGEILTDNREGLDYRHIVNNILKTHILTNLKPLIDSERAKNAENPQLDKNLDNHIKKAFDLMNKLLKKKPNITPIQIFDTPPDDLEFGSENYAIVEKKIKKIKLYLNPGKIPTSSEIALSLTGDGVMINPNSIINAPLSYDTNQDGLVDGEDEIPFVEIEVTAKELVNGKPTRSTLKAVYGDYEDETEINVITEPSIYPKNGFAFIPKKISIKPKKKRQIKLLIDTNLIAVGTTIDLECNDDRITFTPNTLTVSGPPNIGQYLTEEIITISGSKIGIKAKLTAETETKTSMLMGQSTRETRISICEIQVKEKEPPKTFFKDYKLCNECDKRVRSSFVKDEGLINIHVNSPILKYTFGPVVAGTPKHLHDKKPEALTLLADTVVDRMTFELAKHLVESGEVDTFGDITDEIQGLKGDLEYENGLPLLQTIIFGYAKHENDLS